MDRLMSRYLGFTFALFLLSMLTVRSVAAHPPYSSFRDIEVPGAVLTRSYATNDRGMIVGVYAGEALQWTGFMQIGRFITELKAPRGGVDLPTDLRAINDRGEIAGHYMPITNYQAFLFSRGQFTEINIPDAYASMASGINNQGKVVGSLAGPQGEQGFLFDGDAVTIIDVPSSYSTTAIGINDKDQIVGNFIDTILFTSHGFLLEKAVYQTIDMPNSESTSVIGINNRGQIVGSYRVNNVDHYFLLHSGQFTPIDIDIPDSDILRITGINNQGRITGSYYDLIAQKGRGFTVHVRELTD